MAIDLRVETIAPGTCLWCGREKEEVLVIAFSDKSFSGPLCHADLKKMLRVKLGGLAPKPIPVAAPALPVGSGNGPGK